MRDRRTSWLCTLAVVALLAPAAGCIITDGRVGDDVGDDDDDDPRCDELVVEWFYFRNPETGVCESGRGEGECFVADDGSIYPADRGPVTVGDWANCWSVCEGLDENICLATPGCRGAYEGFVCPPDTNCLVPDELTFLECWGTAPSGPVQGQCWDLDAYECSRHDDCIAFYNYVDGSGGDDAPPPREADSPTPTRHFTQCAPEPAPTECGDRQTCPVGTHCECVQPPCEPGMACPEICQLLCIPDDPAGCYSDADCGAGYECTAETECLPGPGCENGACPPVCYGRCVPVEPGPDPGECYGEVACDAAPPACPAGTLPGVSGACWSGFCIPESDCDPRDPGSCYGEVACDSLPPECPEGTVPGVEGNCWSGYCIPTWACEDAPVPECIELDEPTCASRADCQPIYQGEDCTCTPDGNCACNDWHFQICGTTDFTPFP